MPKLRFFLSSDGTAPAPPASELFETEADSPEGVANQLRRLGNWRSVWLHVLVSASGDGEPGGFTMVQLQRDI